MAPHPLDAGLHLQARAETESMDEPQMLLNDRGSHGGNSLWVLPAKSTLEADQRAAEEAVVMAQQAQQTLYTKQEVRISLSLPSTGFLEHKHRVDTTGCLEQEDEMRKPGMDAAMQRVDAAKLSGNEAFK